jgi:hypothetical protein
MSKQAFIFALTICLVAAIGPMAHAQIVDDAFALGLVLDHRASQESTKQIIYKITKM